MLDPAAFDPASVDAETRALNAEIVAKLSELPDPWSVPLEVVRERRRQGLGPFPPMARSARARAISIPGPAGDIPARVVAPQRPRGVYLHVHGGGWTWGSAEEQDPWLDRLADRCGLACVSIEYRLAPEHPHPAAADDCEAAALWLLREGAAALGAERLVIGGESAGAHLSLVTLLRLRDRHGLATVLGANLFAGCYDLGLTPSAATWGPEKLVLNTRDIGRFADNLCGPGLDRRDPDVSPLYADLAGLPPLLVSVGTRDPLLDDSLFLAARVTAARGRAELALWPGGAHVFHRFPGALSERALARIDDFMNGVLG